MRKKFLTGLLIASLSAFMFGCNSTSNEVSIPEEKTTGKEKQQGEDEYLSKISSTIVNISLHGSLRQMRTVAETGEFSDNIKEELKKSNIFFQGLIEDFENHKIPKQLEDYNEEILGYIKNAKESLEKLQEEDSKDSIKEYANKFIEDNTKISNTIDKILLYFGGC